MPVYPIAAGHPDYSSTGTSKFIPQIWSTKLVVKFYAATVFGDIANTDYEGEIKAFGDTVIIRTIPDIVIRDYTKGLKLNYENPERANVDLTIDKGKYFAFAVDDVDKKQSDLDFVDDWAEDASEQMKIAIDKDILAALPSLEDASNSGTTAGKLSSSFNLGTSGSAITLTKANVLDYIVDCGSILSEQNVPETNRWIVLPEWACNLLKKSDLKDASLTGDETSVLRNGRIGRIDNFMIYKSNNILPDGSSKYSIPFGHKSALTFASQMTDMETLPNPDTFGDLVRGLNVYGYEVIKPESLGILYAGK